MRRIKNHITKTIVAIIALTFTMQATAQEREQAGFLHKLKGAATKTADFIDYVLNDSDTAYVARNLYNLTVMPQYSLGYEYYSLSSLTDGKQSVEIAPDCRNKITLNVGWRWIIVGYGINLNGKKPQFDFNTSLYSARFGLDLFYRKNNAGYKIRELDGFHKEGAPLQNYNKEFDGISIKQMGIGLCYAFNKRFSYAAAYGQSTRQRRSAGSLILGAGYNRQQLTFDHEMLETPIAQQLKSALKFKEVEYNDISLNLGYTYNWVFAKNFLAGLSVTPAVSCKFETNRLMESEKRKADINFDLTARAALLYNNGRYYTGASFVSHTFNYKKEQLSMLDSFGILEVYVGYNFWRRKR